MDRVEDPQPAFVYGKMGEERIVLAVRVAQINSNREIIDISLPRESKLLISYDEPSGFNI